MEPLTIFFLVLALMLFGALVVMSIMSYQNSKKITDAVVRIEGEPKLSKEEIIALVEAERLRQEEEETPTAVIPPTGTENDFLQTPTVPTLINIDYDRYPTQGFANERIRDLQLIVPSQDYTFSGSLYDGDYLQYLDPVYGFIAALDNGQARLSSAAGTLNRFGIPARQFFLNIQAGALVYRSIARSSPRPTYIIVRWRPQASFGTPWRTYRAVLQPPPRSQTIIYPIPGWPYRRQRPGDRYNDNNGRGGRGGRGGNNNNGRGGRGGNNNNGRGGRGGNNNNGRGGRGGNNNNGRGGRGGNSNVGFMLNGSQ